MPQSFVIQGAQTLEGVISVSGNKNAALPIIAACLLTDEPVKLLNVPEIRDVQTMLDLISELGVSVSSLGNGEVVIHASGDLGFELDADLCRHIRASILLAGPLLSRLGKVVIPPPGGDVIGRRRLDTHIHAFRALGANTEIDSQFTITASSLRGSSIFLDEASVTGTENAVMAAVLAPGETVIANAACEPHVQDLCYFLIELGAKITGVGSNILKITGVEGLSGGTYRICPDHIEAASLMGLGAVTDGTLLVEGVVPEHMLAIWPGFARLGMEWEDEGTLIRVPGKQKLVVVDDIGSQIPKIEDGPWPAFPADLTSIVLAVATQAHGTVLVFEKMFENRLFFVDKLVGMGARIILCDPHRAIVNGPAKLYGERMESPDIRAGMAMLIASLAAEGRSIIGNIAQIDRGYERIDERLRRVGADIERFTE